MNNDGLMQGTNGLALTGTTLTTGAPRAPSPAAC
jgi:filamentous hemagglutinin